MFGCATHRFLPILNHEQSVTVMEMAVNSLIRKEGQEQVIGVAAQEKNSDKQVEVSVSLCLDQD